VSTSLPLQITFRHMDPSPALEARIRELASGLERFSERIVRCRVVVSPPTQHHRASPFEITIEISVPGEEIVVATDQADQSHDDPYAAVNDAFKTARRRLEDHEKRKQDSRTRA
jgi:ribosomal subunit interface protein